MLTSHPNFNKAALQIKDPRLGGLLVVAREYNHVVVLVFLGVKKYGRPHGETYEDLVGRYFCYHKDVGDSRTAQIAKITTKTFATTAAINVHNNDYLASLLTRTTATRSFQQLQTKRPSPKRFSTLCCLCTTSDCPPAT